MSPPPPSPGDRNLGPFYARRGKNCWCGPVALSLITGVDADRVPEIVRERWPGRRVMGMYDREMAFVAARLGYARQWHYTAPPEPGYRRPTWARWAAGLTDPDMRAIVRVGYHYVAIANGLWTDNSGARQTRGPALLADHPRPRTRVWGWLELPRPLKRPAYVSRSEWLRVSEASTEKG